MSDPVPKHPKSDVDDAAETSLSSRLAERKRRERRDRRILIIASVVLHAAVLIGVVLLTPWQSLIDRAQALAEDAKSPEPLSVEQAEKLDDVLEETQAKVLRRRLDELQLIKQEMERLEADQREEFEPFAEQLEQSAPERAIEAVLAAAAKTKAAEEAMKRDDLEQVRDEQAKARERQEEAMRWLEVAEAAALEEIQAKQEKALEAQNQATETRGEAEEAQTSKDHNTRRLENEKPKLEQAEDQLDKAKESVKGWEITLKNKQREADHANAQVEKATEKNDKRKAENQAKKADRELKDTQRRLDRAQQQVESQEKRLESQREKVVEITKALEENTKAAKENREQAKKEQAEAARQQQEVAEAVVQAVRDAVEQSQNESNPADQKETSEPEAAPIDPAALQSIAELHEAAEQLEEEITDAFETVRAMELAVIRETTLDDARASVDDVTPVREAINTNLLSSQARSTAELAAKKDAVSQAVAQAQSRVELGSLLLMQLKREGEGQSGGRLTLALALAAADESQPAPEASGAEDPESSDTTAQGQAAIEGYAEGTADINQPAPPMPTNAQPAARGRQIAANGEGVNGWIAVDDWYVIGPWDNTDRRNLTRQFPPESIVDLDATYPGKSGQTLRWAFQNTQHDRGMVVPLNEEPYGVWYGYTEVKLDRPQTLWLAVGSDDRGSLWVNGKEVWVSAAYHKGWRPDEAVLPVEFKTGRNEILFRCENGWHGMGFSLMLHPASE